MKFQICLGDWSGDGHGRNEYFNLESNKSIEEIREAYFASRKKYPKVCPEKICSEYEEYKIKTDIAKKLIKMRAPFFEDLKDEDIDDLEITPEWLIDIIIWFIGLSDSELIISVIKEPIVPTLHFYGFDKKKRHIDFIGYGLYSIY